MNPLKILVAEGEPGARDRLVGCLNAVGGAKVVAVCNDGRHALRVIERQPLDVALLAVELPDADGMRVAEALNRTQPDVGIVFTALHADYALKAFDLDAVDYVLKPVDAARLAGSLERLRRRRGQLLGAPANDAYAEPILDTRWAAAGVLGGQRLMLRLSGKARFVDVSEIEYVNSEGDYCAVHLGGETLMAQDSLRDLEHRLSPCGFARIHRRLLINLRRLREIRPWRHGDHEFVMASGAVFQSGPTFRDAVKLMLTGKPPA
jgi:two-component system LytT family response regulator